MEQTVKQTGSQDKQNTPSPAQCEGSFEIPVSVLEYNGEIPARIMLYVYWLAECRSPFNLCGGRIGFKLRMDKLAERIKRDPQRTIEARQRLEQEGILEYFADTGKVKLHVHGGKRGVCSNSDLACFDVPNDALPILFEMSAASPLQLYLAMASLAHEQQSQSFTIKRSVLRKRTGLSRPSFNAGEKECVAKKLIRRKGDRWTMLKPPVQQRKNKKTKKRTRLTPEQWEDILVYTLGKEYAAPDPKRWLPYDKHRKCPFCGPGVQSRISVIYDGGGFNCFACGTSGKLTKLLRQAVYLEPGDSLRPWLQVHLRQIAMYKRLDERRYIATEDAEETEETEEITV